MVQSPLPPAGFAAYLTSATPFVRTYARPLVTAAIAAPLPSTPLIVGGALLVVGVSYWYFSEQNRKAAEERAKAKYLAANPDSDVAGELPFEGGQGSIIYNIRYNVTTDTGYVVIPSTTQQAWGPINRVYLSLYDGGTWTTFKTHQLYFNEYSQRSPTLTTQYLSPLDSGDKTYWKLTVESVTRADGQPDTSGNPPRENPKPWQQWTDAQRQAAVDSLDDSDWEDIVQAMPMGGTLSDGDIIGREVLLTGDKDNPFVSARSPRTVAAGTRIPTVFDDQTGPYIAALTAGVAVAAGTSAASKIKPDIDALKNSVAEAQKATNDNFNDLKKRAKNISVGINWDRFLLLMTWWQTLHNCMMLSADISRSLVSSVEIALAALPGDSLLGIPTEDPDGTPLDVGKTISTSFEGFVKGAVGAENYAELKVELAQINRIYQASSNLLNSVQQLTNDLQNLTELCGENISRIGNSLISFGVVGEDAYRRMPEDLDTRTSWVYKLQENLEKGQQLAGNIEAIAQSVYSTEQTLIEITQKTTEFRKAIAEVQPKQAIENKPLTEKAQADKQDSQSPEISKTDLETAPTA